MGVAVEVVCAEDESNACGLGENGFEGLGFDFYLLELGLLRGGSSVGRVPVSVVGLLATSRPCDAPVGHLVKGTRGVVGAVDHPVRLEVWGGGRLVKGLGGAPAQYRVVRHQEAGVEDHLEVNCCQARHAAGLWQPTARGQTARRVVRGGMHRAWGSAVFATVMGIASGAQAEEWGVAGPYALEVGPHAGVVGRVDDPPQFTSNAAVGGAVGFELGLWVSRRIAFTLRYDHSGLGSEFSDQPELDLRLNRALDVLGASIRFDPLRFDPVSFYLRVGPSLVWQQVALNGIVRDAVNPERAVALNCDATGVGFGVGAGLGIDTELTPDLHLGAEGGFDNYRLSDEILGACAPGAGTASQLGFRLRLSYRWSLGDAEDE